MLGDAGCFELARSLACVSSSPASTIDFAGLLVDQVGGDVAADQLVGADQLLLQALLMQLRARRGVILVPASAMTLPVLASIRSRGQLDAAHARPDRRRSASLSWSG